MRSDPEIIRFQEAKLDAKRIRLGQVAHSVRLFLKTRSIPLFMVILVGENPPVARECI